MKLLLVDDEPYTREGILSIIAFDKLGIDEVFSAEDGLSGLAMAKEYQPDIILTDVRMPHLDGISMSYQIREFLPGCCIIFMSGFAEKDYLKSAIKLSAINYIEKPFSPEELETTLQLAVTKCNQEKEQLHAGKTFRSPQGAAERVRKERQPCGSMILIIQKTFERNRGLPGLTCCKRFS